MLDIDNVMYVLKLIMCVSGFWLIARCTKVKVEIGSILLCMVLLMSGMEMSSQHDKPWYYLITQGDYNAWMTAFVGGSIMLISTVVLFLTAYKSIKGGK